MAVSKAIIDHHQTLGLAYPATPQQIREAFVRLVQENHPDHHMDASPEELAAFNNRIARINDARQAIIEYYRKESEPAAPETAPPEEPAPRSRRQSGPAREGRTYSRKEWANLQDLLNTHFSNFARRRSASEFGQTIKEKVGAGKKGGRGPEDEFARQNYGGRITPKGRRRPNELTNPRA